MKSCTKCGEIKKLRLFQKDIRHKDGRGSWCQSCVNYSSSLYRKANSEKIRTANKKWKHDNPEKVKNSSKLYSIKDNKRRKRLRSANPEKYNAISRSYYNRNIERQRECKKKWREANKDKVSAYRKRSHNKIRSTANGKLNARMSCAIWLSLRNNKANYHWEKLVGFTVDQLKVHLEKQFTPEMTWNNHGTYWQIDHKIPIKAFNYETPEDIDFKKCWCLKNLQPLLKKENIIKRDKVDKPFQPSLALSVPL